MWEPLPLIVYGYAVHPLSPSRRETRLSSRNRLSTVTEASTDDHSVMRDVVSLEVGDEIYAFEKYTPSNKDSVEGVWYRGCVRSRHTIYPHFLNSVPVMSFAPLAARPSHGLYQIPHLLLPHPLLSNLL